MNFSLSFQLKRSLDQRPRIAGIAPAIADQIIAVPKHILIRPDNREGLRHRLHARRIKAAVIFIRVICVWVIWQQQCKRHFRIYKHFKEIVREIGMPKERFHDLRHSYAVVSIENGDDMKTVQTNLGHATSSFTLDVYGHVS